MNYAPTQRISIKYLKNPSANRATKLTSNIILIYEIRNVFELIIYINTLIFEFMSNIRLLDDDAAMIIFSLAWPFDIREMKLIILPTEKRMDYLFIMLYYLHT